MKKIKVSLFYPANKVKEPITYHLIKDYNLQINILHADVNLNKTSRLDVDIVGEETDIEEGLKFVKGQEVEYKIFSKEIIWNVDDCVHCGACTAVCPSEAITMNKISWELTFEKEKCLICGLCVKACPLGVIDISE